MEIPEALFATRLNSSRRTITVAAIRRSVLYYVLFSSLWVVGSDLTVFLHGGESWQDTGLSIAKGLFFVLISGAFLYIYIGHCVRDTAVERDSLQKAVEQSPVTVIISDVDGTIQYVNPAFTLTSGYSGDEAVGRNPRFLKSGETSVSEYAALWRSLLDGESWSGVFHNKRKDGTLYWEEAVISPVKDSQGKITQFIAVKQDITVRREAEANANFLAYHDPLTKLPNRLVAENQMDDAIRRAKQTGTKAALMFVDVDNFKRVNDSLGHGLGDRLLQALAERLRLTIRNQDTLARVSGDEFLIVIPELTSVDLVQGIAARIRQLTSVSFEIGGVDLSTTVSIGAAVYPDNGLTFDELQREADVAMYCAKKEGRDAFRIYNKSMDVDGHEYLKTLNGLRRALEKNEFVLYYQPQIHLERGDVEGVEALIRWNHPELGIVPPGRFIPVAEESGLIFEIGDWVIREACRQTAQWHVAGLAKIKVAVNISALQLRRRDFADVVIGALKDSALEPACLELELTESALIHDSAEVSTLLDMLKLFGVGLALDDFGTGYSSFTYLRNFNLDRLKIDQSFVRNISSNRGDEAIVRSIVQLARNLGFETVAEGVETEEILKVVRRAGCDQVQGFFFAAPMPADQLEQYVAQHTLRPDVRAFLKSKCRYYPPQINR